MFQTLVGRKKYEKVMSDEHLLSISTGNVTDFGNDYDVLSSAKLCTDALLMQNKKSFKIALNDIGPTTEPCGTPEIMSLKSLQTLLARIHCLRFFKYV